MVRVHDFGTCTLGNGHANSGQWTWATGDERLTGMDDITTLARRHEPGQQWMMGMCDRTADFNGHRWPNSSGS